MKIGARIIKTAIAVVISIVLGSIFSHSSGFYGAIAAIITMQSTVRDSFTRGKERIFGTIAGAVLGYLFALIYIGNPFLIGIGIILIIYLCRSLKWQSSVVIACVVFLSIMLEGESINALQYSFYRIVDTSIGIAIALLVNYFIFPPKLLSSIYEECEVIFQELSKGIDQVLYQNISMDFDLLHEKIMDVKKKSTIAEIDALMLLEDKNQMKRVAEIIERIQIIYDHLSFVEELKKSDSIFIPSTLVDDSIVQKKLPNIIIEFHSQRVLKEWKKVKSLWAARID